MTLNIYYKKDAEEVSKVLKQEVDCLHSGTIYAEFIRKYHYLTSIKASFSLSIQAESGEYLVKVSKTEDIKMIALNNSLIPYHKAHYLQEYMFSN